MARLMRRKTLSGTPEEILAAVRELPEGHRYHVEINRLDPVDPDELKRLEELAVDLRTPEQIQADRDRILAASRALHPRLELPPGKTADDVMRELGPWPDPTESDEEIEDALEEMS